MQSNENIETFVGTLIVLVVAVVIVLVGWNEPLRYRFMSKEEIYELENPAPDTPPSTPVPGEWMRDPGRRTLLDRNSYDQRRGVRDTIPSVNGL